jgi:hypothetical protein
MDFLKIVEKWHLKYPNKKLFILIMTPMTLDEGGA